MVATEYPGYSVYKSDHISEQTIIEDAEVVLQYLNEKCNVPLDRVFLMGRSLGSGPACYLAAKYQVAGLVLVSAFTSILDVASEHFGFFGKLLLKNRFNNLENIRKVKCPTLIIHGTEDSFVPFSHAKMLCGRQA